MEPASVHLVADLERPRDRGWRRLRRQVWAFVSAFVASPEPAIDLVVRRRATGAEVLRTGVDHVDPADLLATTRDDLDRLTVEQFIREWRIVD